MSPSGPPGSADARRMSRRCCPWAWQRKPRLLLDARLRSETGSLSGPKAVRASPVGRQDETKPMVITVAGNRTPTARGRNENGQRGGTASRRVAACQTRSDWTTTWPNTGSAYQLPGVGRVGAEEGRQRRVVVHGTPGPAEWRPAVQRREGGRDGGDASAAAHCAPVRLRGGGGCPHRIQSFANEALAVSKTGLPACVISAPQPPACSRAQALLMLHEWTSCAPPRGVATPPSAGRFLTLSLTGTHFFHRRYPLPLSPPYTPTLPPRWPTLPLGPPHAGRLCRCDFRVAGRLCRCHPLPPLADSAVWTPPPAGRLCRRDFRLAGRLCRCHPPPCWPTLPLGFPPHKLTPQLPPRLSVPLPLAAAALHAPAVLGMTWLRFFSAGRDLRRTGGREGVASSPSYLLAV